MRSITWSWQRSESILGPLTPITGVKAASYTPVAADLGRYLWVSAVDYTDGEGSDKGVPGSGTRAVQAAPPTNEPTAFPPTETGARAIEENTGPRQDISAPVAATDPDSGDTLTYTLRGTDAASFDIIASSGQLQTKATLDHETKSRYRVTVTVTDASAASDTINVTFTVTNMNETPEFADGDATTRTVNDDAGAGVNIGAPVAATDPDSGDTLTYTLGGPDAASFGIVATSGQLQTKAALDRQTQASYTVVVSVREGKDAIGAADTATDDTITVTITVVDPPPPPPPPPPQQSSGGGGGGGGGDGGVSRNQPPAFADGDATTRTVAENTAAGQDIGAPLEAVDPDRRDTLTYTLEGEDAGSFDIDEATGQLRTKAALDYETRTSYALTARVADRRGSWDAMEVTVTVTNGGLSVTVGRYDRDDNGAIDRDEAIAAVVDYLNGVISKEEAVRRSQALPAKAGLFGRFPRGLRPDPCSPSSDVVPCPQCGHTRSRNGKRVLSQC